VQRSNAILFLQAAAQQQQQAEDGVRVCVPLGRMVFLPAVLRQKHAFVASPLPSPEQGGGSSLAVKRSFGSAIAELEAAARLQAAAGAGAMSASADAKAKASAATLAATVTGVDDFSDDPDDEEARRLLAEPTPEEWADERGIVEVTEWEPDGDEGGAGGAVRMVSASGGLGGLGAATLDQLAAAAASILGVSGSERSAEPDRAAAEQLAAAARALGAMSAAGSTPEPGVPASLGAGWKARQPDRPLPRRVQAAIAAASASEEAARRASFPAASAAEFEVQRVRLLQLREQEEAWERNQSRPAHSKSTAAPATGWKRGFLSSSPPAAVAATTKAAAPAAPAGVAPAEVQMFSLEVKERSAAAESSSGIGNAGSTRKPSKFLQERMRQRDSQAK
jgi:hypothetical protein